MPIPRRIRAAIAVAALLALPIVLAGCGRNQAAQARSIVLDDCRLPKVATAARCGELAVPEDRDRPQGRTIRIAVAVLPANTLHPRPDPLVILAGGPGQAASYLGPFAMQLAGVRKDRDLVLVDQRGTGRSSPLRCEALRPDDSFAATLELDPLPRAEACLRELSARGVDVTRYTTAAWVADLDAVREGLGYAKINLWGGSYGTRVALEYLRRHPDRVRSVILDGVAPPGMKVPLDVWPTRDAALSSVLAACAQSPACANAHPDLGATLERIRDRLGPGGSDLRIADPRTGAPQVQRFTFDHVLAALQPLTYAPELQALLPEVIGRAADGDFGPLYAAAASTASGLAEQVDGALHYAVTCAEDAPRITPAERAGLARIRTHAIAERVLAVCDVWPRSSAPVDAPQAVRSDVPTLILSGELDPVTPPVNGAAVAAMLTRSRHVVARGYGHIVSPHACGPRLIEAFVDDPTFASLPASCLENFARSVRPPLWPDRLGPQP